MPPTKKPGAPRGRDLSVRVKTARQRSHASTLWLERQLNDPYVAAAKRDGWRSRAAYKLLQLDEKYRLLKPGMRVVDLGAAPGGWTQVAVQKIRPEETGGVVIGLDILPADPIPGAQMLTLDFLDDTAPDVLKAALGGPANLVLSDMAAPTVGHRQTDHLRILNLAETAFAFAEEVLAPGGAFVTKLFQGGAEKELLEPLKRAFTSVKHAKPAASRSDSSELYIVAQGFRSRR
jgi:23S rRNA (uridine2552-2'-O)-methyltransferase